MQHLFQTKFITSTFGKLAKEFFTSIADVVFPPVCVGCRQNISTHHTLCVKCWLKMEYITSPACKKCAIPIVTTASEKEYACGNCLHDEPNITTIRSVCRYNDFCGPVIKSFKYKRNERVAQTMGLQMYSQCYAEFMSYDIVAPVPMHFSRFFWRKQNHASLLAVQFVKHFKRRLYWSATENSEIKLVSNLLKRTKKTQSQTGMRKEERAENIKGAFTVNSKFVNSLRGKKVVLIDDVITTGATVEECAKVLFAQGCKEVSAISFARTF